MQTRRALNVNATFEAFKGGLALASASGLLLFLHKDLHDLAIRMVEHAHLNPAAHYPSIFVVAATHLQNMRYSIIALGAAGYSALRFVEAYGLYRDAAWAEIFAAASGAIYVPFEVTELMRHFNPLTLGALVINIVVVVFMVITLCQRRQAKPENSI